MIGRALAAVATVVLLAACGPGTDGPAGSSAPTPGGTTSAATAGTAPAATPKATPAAHLAPLRPGEKRLTLTMPEAYTPSAPTGVGTDDYRCFLLDPGLKRDTFLTGTNVLPGNPAVVHHVILFRVPPAQVSAAKAMDASTPGEGWTCFGGTGLDAFQNVDDAPWLGAWAPGGKEAVHQKGFGVRLTRGTQIIMQVHYNLLAGTSPDTSAAQLRVAPPGAHLTALETMLLPAPVELPCRPGHTGSPLCDRAASIADVKARFGDRAGSTADVLYFLCGGKPHPSEVTSCTRTLPAPMTIRGVAGHMHLLGRSIRIEVNPGTPRARTILDIPIWNFDNQGARPIPPVHLNAFDQVKVTCRHVQWLRDKLPAFAGQPDRYVVWGEGTTDEMCLGILQVTRP